MTAPDELLLPINIPVLLPNGKMDPVWWQYFIAVAQGLGTIDLTSQVTGVLPFANGGTSHSDLQFTTSGATNVTLPTSGTVVTYNQVQQQTASTGSIAGGAEALVTLTWPVSFGNTNYAAVASVLDSTAAAASLTVVHVETRSATQIQVRVLNSSGGNLTGTVMAIGLHA